MAHRRNATNQGPRDSGIEYVFRPVADIAAWVPGGAVIASGAGPHGELIALVAGRAEAATAMGRIPGAAGAALSSTRVEPPYRATIVHLSYNGTLINLMELPEVFVAHAHVQTLPTGGYLVVGARTQRFRDGSFEKNAYVYSSTGQIDRNFLMGDGIQDVQCDTAGGIWTSFFDEGIFGNYGWNEPVGSAGLVRFDAEGGIKWRFQPPANFEPMADCYALNVVSLSDVFVYYYGAFAVMRISAEGLPQAWRTTVKGAGGLAIFSGFAALMGSYDERDRIFQGQLLAEDLAHVSKHRYRFDGIDGEVKPSRIHGRGSAFARTIGTRWYRCDIREYFAA